MAKKPSSSTPKPSTSKSSKKSRASAKKSKQLPKIPFDPLMAIFLTIGLLTIGLGLIFYLTLGSSIDNSQICTESECVVVASSVIKHMDPEVDPCDDFYKAACGRFSESHLRTKEGLSSLEREINLADYEVAHMLNSNNTNSDAEKKAKILYDKCMKDPGDFRSLYKEVKNLGGCPALDPNWDENTFDMTGTMIKMAKVMPENLGFFGFKGDVIDGKIKKMMTYASSMNIKYRSKYGQDSQNVLRAVLETLFKYVVKDNSLPLNPNLPNEIEQVLELDLDIQRAMPEKGDFNKIPKILYFDIDRFSKGVMKNGKALSSIAFSSDYFSQINKLLESKSKGEIQNYLVFRFMEAMCFFTFHEDKVKKQPVCAEMVKSLVPGTIAVAYAARKVRPENIATADKMIEDIKAGYIREFEKNKWMDAETKKKAVKKVKAIKSYIALPDELKNKSKLLDKVFERFNLKPSDRFFQMALKIHTSYSDEYFNVAGDDEPVGFGLNPIGSNAGYDGPSNSLRVQELLLRPPLFDAALPDYFNLGSMGHVIAHEIGHAFDIANGEDVWSKKSKTLYQEKSGCIKKQYGEYKFNGFKVNGTLTLQENVADSFGLRAAYNTLEKLTDGKDEDEMMKLPGLQNITTKQLFFYSIANFYCRLPSTAEYAKNFVNNAPHSPDPVRINGIVSNLEEFAKAFNCKPNSPMNPKKRCEMF